MLPYVILAFSPMLISVLYQLSVSWVEDLKLPALQEVSD